MRPSANSYVGREDERAIAVLLDLTIPGPRFPTTKRELIAYYERTGLSPAPVVEEKFSDWMSGDRSPMMRPHWGWPFRYPVGGGRGSIGNPGFES
jgi:hypothetical protein